MNSFFNSVHITNFKSLKDVTLSDCKRINLLIGRPNVGKSNILEALGLFGLGHSRLNTTPKLTQFIRFEDLPELFFDADTDVMPSIDINIYRHGLGNHYKSCRIKYLSSTIENMDRPGPTDKQLAIQFFNADIDKGNSRLDDELFVDDNFNLTVTGGEILSVKQYKFPCHPVTAGPSYPTLIPPYGSNILQFIQSNKELRQELSLIFAEYGLKPLIDKTNHTLRLIKPLNEDNIVSFPYSSIADTLQRIIFFKTAIASNQNSILLFEEPEAHCFPPYIAQITQDIIDSETNQFFIATHSPYVLNDFMEYKETRDQLAIYMADSKDGQTIVYRLTDEELDEVYSYGIDVFFNYERFTAHG